MQLKPIAVVAVLLLVVTLGISVTGCADFKQVTPSAQPSSSGTTSAPTRLSTVVQPESNADAWLLEGIPVARGSDIRIYTEINSPSEGKNICGAVNYYIDDRAAGGEWHVNSGDACQAIAGWLHLSPTDTMQLSAGAHTLKIDYAGSDTYAPSHFVTQFTVKPTGAMRVKAPAADFK